jgi:peptidoglycan/LPS O-acetylase OafA/YrhL
MLGSEKQVMVLSSVRRYDVDWLRVLAMFLIFVFHVARFFDYEWWHVKNNELSFEMTGFVFFLGQWLMPLFFVLSGASIYYALAFRKNRQFVHERVRRLMVPLVFGIFVLIPPQVYLERVTYSQFTGNFLQFYPNYFNGFYGFGGNFAWMGFHLWYLLFLFLYSVSFLPLFMLLRKDSGKNFVSGMTGFFGGSITIFLLALPLVLLELILDPAGLGMRGFGGWNLFAYMVFFVYGYIIFSNQKFQQTIKRCGVIALVFGIITTAIGGFLLVSLTANNSTPLLLAEDVSFSILRGFNSWFWIIAILGLGSRYLDFNNRFLKYANEAVLPFYILHQTVIVIIGFYVGQWDFVIPVKFIIIATMSFTIILFLYVVVIKRVNLFRFLFGMRLKKEK